MFSNIFVFILLFGLTLCSSTFEFDLKNNITSLSMKNYPLTLARHDIHTWVYRAMKNDQIVIRVHKILLFPGDEIIIYDESPDAKALLAKFSTFNSSTKLISWSDKISIELTSTFNLSNPSLLNDSHIFAFEFTLEVAGYCSSNNTDRVSCESSELSRCYSALEDRCDGFWDCPTNGHDEIGCSCPTSTGFTCADFAVTEMCYSLAERCDGVYNCADKSDEAGCLESQCSLNSSRFLCLPLNASSTNSHLQTGECISLSRICDDHEDCSNAADEASELCRDSAFSPSNISSSSPPLPGTPTQTQTPMVLRKVRIAQHFASLVTKVAVEDAVVAATSRMDSRLRTLLTYVLSALLGPLLIVLTVGLMCRSSAASATAGRRSVEEARRARQQARYNSPIQRLIREEIRRRPPPPTYEEALNNSLFEEPILEGAIVPPLVSPPAIPGVLSQDRIAAVREMSMKPAPTRVDVAVSCDLLGHGVTITPSPSSLMAASPNNAVIEAAASLPRHFSRREVSTTSREDQIESVGVATTSGSSTSDGNAQTNASGLLHRWFLSALGGLRRNGNGLNGNSNSSGSSDTHFHHGSSYEQPEVSEATVVSSMHEEEEEEEEGENDPEDEYGGRDEEDDYRSMSSRRNSVDSQSDEHEDERDNERRLNSVTDYIAQPFTSTLLISSR
ncbi:unnamed protein product [Hymenolepis diminuta]|uniref:CUB domain-containing protein n=2 Tax=Hymenolepis diminuta TaxID=6216 RepID=A0A564ZAJ0_HYMDI|nr:unnamed protein product [Hymenolepis diminuta]